MSTSGDDVSHIGGAVDAAGALVEIFRDLFNFRSPMAKYCGQRAVVSGKYIRDVAHIVHFHGLIEYVSMFRRYVSPSTKSRSLYGIGNITACVQSTYPTIPCHCRHLHAYYPHAGCDLYILPSTETFNNRKTAHNPCMGSTR